MGRSIPTVAVGTCALVVLAACGNSDDVREARLAAHGLYAAVEAERGAAACPRLTRATREALSKPVGAAHHSTGVHG